MSALPAQRTPVFVYQSAPGSFYDSIIVRGQVQDMTGAASPRFFLRPASSRAPIALAGNAVYIIPTDGNGKNIRYDFASADVAVEGDYYAWWQFTLPSLAPMETPEFPVIITDHGPGAGTQTGGIVDGVSAFMPVTLDRLRRDDRFGDRWLQQQAEIVKWRVMGQTMTADAEETLHPVLLDFLSKRLALHLIKPAIEWWSRQQRTITATQTSEVSSFPDMIASLQMLEKRLVIELEQEWRDLRIIVPGLAQRKVIAMPASTLGDPSSPLNDYSTANPRATQRLMTGGFGWGLEFGNWPFP